ncbi:MAG: VOC family protein [Chloroflexi bacterium]|nr:VOC family protein [Chloroflexota bacterium]
MSRGRSVNRLLKVDNIMYRVADLESAAVFYDTVLGLTRAWTDEQRKMAGFVLAESDAELVIHANPDLPRFDYSFLVENVVRFCEEFRNRGHKVALGPIDVRCGKYAVLSDPDGNSIPIIDLTSFRASE